MIPLKNRVCFTAMVNRIPSSEGDGHPRCIGEECANYEQCEVGIVEAICKMEKLTSKPKPLQRIRRDEP